MALVQSVEATNPEAGRSLRSELALQLALSGAPQERLTALLAGGAFSGLEAIQVAVAEWIAGDESASTRLKTALSRLGLPEALSRAAQIEFVCTQLQILLERGYAPPPAARACLLSVLDARASFNNAWLRPPGDLFAKHPTVWTWALATEDLAQRAAHWSPPERNPPDYLGDSPIDRGLGLFSLLHPGPMDLKSLVDPWWQVLCDRLHDLHLSLYSTEKEIADWQRWLGLISPHLPPDASDRLRRSLLEESPASAALLDLCGLQAASQAESNIDWDGELRALWSLLATLPYGPVHHLSRDLVGLALTHGSDELLGHLCASLQTWAEGISQEQSGDEAGLGFLRPEALRLRLRVARAEVLDELEEIIAAAESAKCGFGRRGSWLPFLSELLTLCGPSALTERLLRSHWVDRIAELDRCAEDPLNAPTGIFLDGLSSLAFAQLDCALLAESLVDLDMAEELVAHTLSDERILGPHHAAISGGSCPHALETWISGVSLRAAAFQDSGLRETIYEHVLGGLDPSALGRAFQIAPQVEDPGFATSLTRALRQAFAVLPRLG